MPRAFDATCRLLLALFAVAMCAPTGVASADPTPRPVDVRLSAPVAGRTTVTLRFGAITRRVVVGTSAAPGDLEPLFVGLPHPPDSAVISAEPAVPYRLVITVMDALRRHQIVNVSLNTAERPVPPRG